MLATGAVGLKPLGCAGRQLLKEWEPLYPYRRAARSSGEL